MTPQPVRNLSATLALSALASGLLYYFGTGLQAFGPLVLAAPVPVLLFAFRASLRSTIICASFASILGGLNMVSYLSRFLPPSALMVALLIPALAFVLAIVATRASLLSVDSWIACLIFPAVWTSY